MNLCNTVTCALKEKAIFIIEFLQSFLISSEDSQFILTFYVAKFGGD